MTGSTKESYIQSQGNIFLKRSNIWGVFFGKGMFCGKNNKFDLSLLSIWEAKDLGSQAGEKEVVNCSLSGCCADKPPPNSSFLKQPFINRVLWFVTWVAQLDETSEVQVRLVLWLLSADGSSRTGSSSPASPAFLGPLPT